MYKMFIGPTSSEIEIPWIRIVGKLFFVLLLFQTLSLAQSLDSIFVHVQGQVYVHGLDLEEDSTHSSEIPVYVSENAFIVNFDEVKNVKIVSLENDNEKQQLSVNKESAKEKVDEVISKSEEIIIAQKESEPYLNINPKPQSISFFFENFQDLKLYLTSNKTAFAQRNTYIKDWDFKWIPKNSFKDQLKLTSQLDLLYKVRPPPIYG